MKRTHTLSALLLGAAVLPAHAQAMYDYRIDDGVKEQGIGIQSTGLNAIAWLNRFVVEPTGAPLTDIGLAFGGGLTSSNNIPNGTLVSVYIWADPNQDGQPDDAVVLGTGSGLIDHSGLNQFNNYTLNSPVALLPGDIFFAGAIVEYNGQQLVASIDTDGTDDIPNYLPMNHSWIAGSANGTGVDPNFLNLAQLPVASVSSAIFGGNGDGTWMIRVNLTNNTPCHPDFNGDGRLDFFDVSIFLSAFTNMDFTIADYNMDGAIDFFDVSAFLADFQAGCP
ncbi:MAG: hypothetical protein KDA29_04095 [Phycisphaerales bacterium]|nr:hypothetical protein [Phycisphaerales bacterium]